MNILETLNKILLKSKEADKACLMDPEIYKNIASVYAQTENLIAVLSDMRLNKSYVFSSRTASELGLSFPENPTVIDSIWEEEILKRIHPDDRMKKYIHEMRFFKLLEDTGNEKRSDFCVVSKMRLLGKNDVYEWIRHRMFYFYSPYAFKLRFALCLYDRAAGHSKGLISEFLIINTVKGEVVAEDKFEYKHVLSQRELEVLHYVGKGFTSKEIAELLSISINTINRHRQNILQKLNVKNSVEALNGKFISRHD
ncbi:helix-turn-helix transcriptional regulator [Chryseobacterium sp. SSA4.19]|uniref:response regulator transcription factor n=1 Tax=Chryseobacterium sp. SSA4.19 TaxID=2919915 RepID=UPI001F4DF067|nr:helix-turn-helix transcriptional regulator [Chryseobacterium sp. SSA4.19]MCJ8154382.1 helix-turn-helix transcriptional regulator [Chryseobacterium sp. SSA4.19]